MVGGSWAPTYLEKTDVIFLTKQHIALEVELRVCDTILTTKKVVKRLGVRGDPKAGKITGMLSKLRANIDGARLSKRKIQMATVNSILL